MGPNYKKLMIRFATKDAIPQGGSVLDGVRWLEQDMPAAMREANKTTREAVDAVRNACDPNPYRNSTDEEIARAILDKIENHGRP